MTSESEKSKFSFSFREKCNNSRIVLKKKIMKSLDGRGKLNRLLEIFLAEIIGTGLLMYFGCMGSFASVDGFQTLPPIQSGLVFGFVVSSIIVAFGHISNAHLNPSVTLSAYLLGTISLLTTIVYLVAECIGAILGIYLLQVTTPQKLFESYLTNSITCGFCTTTLAKDVSPSQGFLIEFTATSFLIFVVCSVWDPRNANTNDSVALKFGFLITALSVAAGPFTGASLNPARTLAPAIINNNWNYHWLYWLAPLCGSAVTTSLYKYVFMRGINSLTVDDTVSHVCDPSLKECKALNDSLSESKTMNIA